MAINPFEILKNLKNIQERMGEFQEKLRLVKVAGTAGGDLVCIQLNGQMEVESVKIAAEAVDSADIQMLEDLVLAAITDALTKLKERLKDEMSTATGGMNLPPGLMGL